MFYSQILKLNTGKFIKAVMLFIDALIGSLAVIYVERLIVMLCYDTSWGSILSLEGILSYLSMCGLFALFRTASLMKEGMVEEERPRFVKVLPYALFVGILAGIITNAVAEVKPNISEPAAIATVSLLSTLWAICAYYIGIKGVNNA